MNSAKSYTIVFNQNQPAGRSLKVAANNILNEENVPSISDYYQQKFRKKTTLEEIGEEEENEVQKNNFVAPKKANGGGNKVRRSSDKQENRANNASKERLVKCADGWKR